MARKRLNQEERAAEIEQMKAAFEQKYGVKYQDPQQRGETTQDYQSNPWNFLDEATKNNIIQAQAARRQAMENPTATFHMALEANRRPVEESPYRMQEQSYVDKYRDVSDEDLENRFKELSMVNWAKAENSDELTRELNEIETVQEYRKQKKLQTEQEDAAKAYRNKKDKAYAEAFDKGDNVRELLEEYADLIGEDQTLAMSNPNLAMLSTTRRNEIGARKQEVEKELKDMGVTNIPVLLQYIQEDRDEAYTKQETERARRDIGQKGAKGAAAAVGYNLLDLALNPVSGGLAALESLRRRGYADPEAPVNTSGPLYAAKNLQQTTEEATNRKIAREARTEAGARAGQMLYGVGMSSAKSMEAALLGSGVAGALGLTGNAARAVNSFTTLPIFGSDAYASTLKEQQDKGIPTDQAMKYAVASGINEMLFEVLSMDKIYGTLHRSGKTTAKAVIMDTLAQAGIEGSEEGLTDVANLIADDIINKGESQYNRRVENYMSQGYSVKEAKEMANRLTLAEIGEDVLAGALSGGFSGAGANTYSAVQTNNVARVVKETRPELIEQVRETARNAEEGSVAREIAESAKETKDFTTEEIGSMLGSLSDQAEGDMETVLTDRFVELGESKKEAKADAQEIISAVTAEEVSEEESDQRVEKFEANENLSAVYGETMRGELAPVQTTLSQVRRAYDNRNATTDNIRAVSEGRDGYVLTMKNGDQISPEQLREQDFDTQALVGWAMESDTPQEATVRLTNRPKNMPYTDYKTAYQGIIRAAMEEIPLEQVKASYDAYTSRMEPSQIQNIYYFGENKALERAKKNLTKEQTAAVEAISKATGITVQIGGRNLSGSNGVYDPQSNTIYVSDKTLNPAAVVVGHELVHELRQNSAELYHKMDNLLLGYWKEKDPALYKEIYENRARRYGDQIKEWRSAGRSEEEIRSLIDEEIIAHSTEALFERWGNMDESDREDFAERMVKEDRSLAQRILDFVRDLLEKLRNALKGYQATSYEARVLKENIELLNDFEDTFSEILAEYGERNRAEGKKGEVVDKRGEKTEEKNSNTMQNIKELPEDFEEIARKNKEKVARMDTIATVSSRRFQKGEKSIIDQVADYYAEIGGMVESEELGDIELNRRGIKDSLGHGKMSRSKAAMFAAVPDVLKKGRVVIFEKNWKNRNYDTAVVVGPTTISGEEGEKTEFLTAVVVVRNKEMQRFYMHSIYAIKNDELPFTKTGTSPENGIRLPGSSSSSIYNILREIAEIKTNLKFEHGKENQETVKKSNDNQKNNKEEIHDKNVDVRKSLKETGEDSEGKRLTADQIEFFKDSKIVDEEGRLLRVYHGTEASFTVFDLDMARDTEDIEAFFFSGDREESGGYGKVGEYYLNITNPADYDTAYDIFFKYRGTSGAGAKTREELEKLGYDGVIARDEDSPEYTEYLAFRPEQIKRTDNKHPTKNPDIRYSKKELTEIDEVLEAEAERLKGLDFWKDMARIGNEQRKLNVSTKDYPRFKRMANELAQEYATKMDRDELAGRLMMTYNYWLNNDAKVNSTDLVRSMIGIARPIMEEAAQLDESTKNEYENLRAALKGKKIRLSTTQKEEIRSAFDSLAKYRGQTFSYFTISDEGIPLDSIWSELVKESGNILSKDTGEGEMPLELLSAIKSLKPHLMKKVYEEAGMDENQIAVDIALDIYGKFAKLVSDQTSNQSLKEDIKRLTEKRVEYRKEIKKEFEKKFNELKQKEKAKRERDQEIYEWELQKRTEQLKLAMARSDKKQQEKYQKSVEYYQKKLQETREDRDEKILALRARYRENNSQRRVNQDIQRKRASVIRTANAIGTLLSTNTDKKHVPEVLKKPVYDFISGVKYFGSGEAQTQKEIEWSEKLEKMMLMLGDKGEAEQEGYSQLWHTIMDQSIDGKQESSLLTDMENFLKNHGEERMSDMGLSTLEELNELMKGLKRAIDNMNQLYVNRRTESVQELGDQTIRELAEKKKLHNMTKVGSMANELLNVSQLDAYSYFHRLGPAAESVYRGFRDSQNEWIRKIGEAETFMKDLIGNEKIRNWAKETKTFHFGGREVTLTIPQIMSLYELMNRKQAEEHIIFGGIKPADFKRGAKTITQERTRITLQEAGEIVNTLTNEQKRIADGIQRFMNNQAAEWGNATTMKLYGYRRFLTKDYFPIAVDKDSVDMRETSRLNGARMQGFTKETKEHAKNPLMLKDIFDVFTQHITGMATYSAYSPSLMDARKWHDYRLTPDSEMLENDPDLNPTIQGQIRRVYGADMLKYFENLIADINNERKADTAGTGLYDMLLGNAKSAAIAGNIRVVVQQPTAYARALAVMDPKYLTAAIFTKQGSKNAKEHSAIAQWKSAGHWETGIASSLKSEITGQQSAREWINDKLLWLAGKADDLTWGKLWNAVELETKDKHKDVEVGSKEYYELCEERFDSIIDQTQVVDTVLHRSQIMRSKNGITKMLTSFMAEPTKSYNLLMNRARDWYEAVLKNDKKAARRAAAVFTRAAGAFLITAALNAAAQSMWDAVRGAGDEPDDIEDPEERWLAYWERFLEEYVSNLTDNINPLNLLPYAKDLMSIFSGFTNNNLNMQGLAKTVQGVKKLMKYFEDEDYRRKNTFYDSAKGLVQGISYLAGIPVYNVMRDAVAVYQTFSGKKFGGRVYTATQNKEQISEALLEGNAERVDQISQRMEESGKDESEILSAVKSGLKEKYKNGEISADQYEDALVDAGMAEAEAEKLVSKQEKSDIRQQFREGTVTEDQYVDFLRDQGMDETEIYFDLKEQQYKKENGSDANYSRYRELANTLLTGDYDGYTVMKNEYLSAGLTDKRIKTEVAKQITAQVKEEIVNGTLNSSTQAKYLNMYQRLGYKREDALKKVQDLVKKHQAGEF